MLLKVGWCDHLRCLEKGFIKISNTCCTVCLPDIEKTWGNEIPGISQEFKTHVSIPNRRNWNSASIWGVCVSKDSSQTTTGWIAEKDILPCFARIVQKTHVLPLMAHLSYFVWCPWVKVCLLNMINFKMEIWKQWRHFIFFKWNKYYLYTVQTMACSQVENNIMIDEILNTMKTCTKYQVVNFCPPFCLTSVWGSLNKTLQHQVCCLGPFPFWKVLRALRGLDITHSYKQLR